MRKGINVISGVLLLCSSQMAVAQGFVNNMPFSQGFSPFGGGSPMGSFPGFGNSFAPWSFSSPNMGMPGFSTPNMNMPFSSPNFSAPNQGFSPFGGGNGNNFSPWRAMPFVSNMDDMYWPYKNGRFDQQGLMPWLNQKNQRPIHPGYNYAMPSMNQYPQAMYPGVQMQPRVAPQRQVPALPQFRVPVAPPPPTPPQIEPPKAPAYPAPLPQRRQFSPF